MKRRLNLQVGAPSWQRTRANSHEQDAQHEEKLKRTINFSTVLALKLRFMAGFLQRHCHLEMRSGMFKKTTWQSACRACATTAHFNLWPLASFSTLKVFEHL
eukprot:2380608-Amphidinium_carterae.1